MKALVLFSGGQDSTTCLYYAIKKYKEVEAITFNYGQSHSIELQCSQEICKKNNIKQTIVDISFLDHLVKSALINKGDVNKLNSKGLPNSFVPNRNQLFITLSHAYCQKINFDILIIGVCETDYLGYPDCRNEFIKLIELTSNIGSKSDIQIETPLMELNKAQIFQFADNLNCLTEVIEESHTCYNGDRLILHNWGYGCDNCPSCNERKKGFLKYKENGSKH